MSRSLYMVLGVMTAGSLVVAQACVVEDTDGTTATSSTRASSTTSANGGAGGGTGGAATGGSAGAGGAACLSCNDFLMGGTFPDDLCGFSPPQSCDVGSSCEIADDFIACACDTAAGACGEVGTGACDANLCSGSGSDAACDACITTQCSTEFNACSQDT